MNEYKDIPGYEGKYKTNGSSIRSYTSWHKGKDLTPFKDKSGNLCVKLIRDGKGKNIKLLDLWKENSSMK